jgi:acyl-CoA synthetase (NDP forming)
MVEIASLAAIAALAKQGVDVLSGATSIYEKIKGTKAEEDPEGLKKLATELADELYKARMTQLEIQTTVQALQLEARDEEEFERVRSKYAVRVLEAGGQILSLREQDETGTYFENVCPVCVVTQRRVFPLQGRATTYHLKCPNCDAAYPNNPKGAAITIV